MCIAGLILSTVNASQLAKIAASATPGSYLYPLKMRLVLKNVDERDAKGFLVLRVIRSSPADVAGLQQYDTVTNVDGEPLLEPSVIESKCKGSRRYFELSVQRGGGVRDSSIYWEPGILALGPLCKFDWTFFLAWR